MTENNAYSMILLVEGDEVIGVWDFEENGVKESFENPGDLRDWQATHPQETRVSDYGEVIEEKTAYEAAFTSIVKLEALATTRPLTDDEQADLANLLTVCPDAYDSI